MASPLVDNGRTAGLLSPWLGQVAARPEDGQRGVLCLLAGGRGVLGAGERQVELARRGPDDLERLGDVGYLEDLRRLGRLPGDGQVRQLAHEGRIAERRLAVRVR